MDDSGCSRHCGRYSCCPWSSVMTRPAPQGASRMRFNPAAKLDNSRVRDASDPKTRKTAAIKRVLKRGAKDDGE